MTNGQQRPKWHHNELERGAERVFGYTAAETIGRHITILIRADRLDEEKDILGRLRRGEQVVHFETVRRRKDGTLPDISLAVSPVKDRSGKIIGASKIARDITNRARAGCGTRAATAHENAEGRPSVSRAPLRDTRSLDITRRFSCSKRSRRAADAWRY